MPIAEHIFNGHTSTRIGHYINGKRSPGMMSLLNNIVGRVCMCHYPGVVMAPECTVVNQQNGGKHCDGFRNILLVNTGPYHSYGRYFVMNH